MKIKQHFRVVAQSVLATFFVALIVVAATQAATTIGNNITMTAGNIDVTGTSDTVVTVNGSTSSTTLAVYQSSTGDVVNFFDTGTEVFTILDGGKTGVSSSTPQAILAVQASGGSNAFMVGSSSAEILTINDNGVTVGNEDGLAVADFRWEGDSRSDVLMVDASADRVGIGSTTPWGLLAVEQATESYSFIVMNSGSSTPSFVVSGVDEMGRVGVGTSTPHALFSIGQDMPGVGTSTMFSLGFNDTTDGTTTLDIARFCARSQTEGGSDFYWWFTSADGGDSIALATSTTSCF